MTLAERVPVLVSALGTPEWLVREAHRAGTKVMSLVGNVRQARRLEQMGVDVIIAQGAEAGGHVGSVTTLVLVPQVVDAVEVPVLAAGGIGDGRGVAAALMLGAEGAWIGTRFLATVESSAHENHKKKILAVDEEGTVVSRCYTGKPSRVLKNRFTDRWKGHGGEVLPMPWQRIWVERLVAPAKAAGRVDIANFPTGQVAGAITASRTPPRWCAVGEGNGRPSPVIDCCASRQAIRRPDERWSGLPSAPAGMYYRKRWAEARSTDEIRSGDLVRLPSPQARPHGGSGFRLPLPRPAAPRAGAVSQLHREHRGSDPRSTSPPTITTRICFRPAGRDRRHRGRDIWQPLRSRPRHGRLRALGPTPTPLAPPWGALTGRPGKVRRPPSLDDAVRMVERHRATVLWGVTSFVRRVAAGRRLGADFPACGCAR